MSGERQQKHLPGETAQGAASSPRVSSLQNPEHGPPYGSAPDITSSGIYKVKDDCQTMTSHRETQDDTKDGTDVKEDHVKKEKKITSLWSLQPKVSSTSKIESESLSTVKLELPKKEKNQQENDGQETGTALQFKMDRLVEHITVATAVDEDVDRSEVGKYYSSEDFDSIEVLMNEQPILTSTPNNSLLNCPNNSPEELTAPFNGDGIVLSEDMSILHSNVTNEDISTVANDTINSPDIWADAEDHTTEGSLHRASNGVSEALDTEEISSAGNRDPARKPSDYAEESQLIRKHRPTHAKIQKRLSKDFENELEHALKALTSNNPHQIGSESEQPLEDSYSKNSIPSVDFETGISNVSLSDFSQRNIRSHRPVCTRVTQSGNRNTVETGSNGTCDGEISNVTPVIANQNDTGATSISTDTDNHGHITNGPSTESSNSAGEAVEIQDVPKVTAGRFGRRKSDSSDEHSQYYHKQRPKHWTIQRRLSLSRLEHLPDGDQTDHQHEDGFSSRGQDLLKTIQQKRLSLPELKHLHTCNGDIEDLQVEDVSSSTGENLLKNDLSVKFSDTVMVNVFSSCDSKSLSSATVLNDAAEKNPVDENCDRQSDSGAPPLDQPVPVSRVRRNSAGKVVRPADIIKKKQKKQAEAMLSQDKSSKLTQGKKSSSILHDVEDVITKQSAGHCKSDVPDSNLQREAVKELPSDELDKESSLKDVGSSILSLEGDVKSYEDVDFNNPSALLEHLRDTDVDSQLHHSLMNYNYTTPSEPRIKDQDEKVIIGKSKTSEYMDQGMSSQKSISVKEVDSEVNERIISVHPTVITDHTADTKSSYVGKTENKSGSGPTVKRKIEESSEIFYPTSSTLFQTMDGGISAAESLSPGYGGLDHTIPSDVVMKSKRKGSIIDDTELKFPTSSELFEKKIDLEAAEKKFKSSDCEETDDKGLYGATGGFIYTTPSKLLTKYQDRETTTAQPNSPGYTALDHTTPSRLFQKWLNYKRKTSTKSQSNNKVSSNSVLQRISKDSSNDAVYPASSKLFQKRADRERTGSDKELPPRYEEFHQAMPAIDKNKEERIQQMHPTSSRLFGKRADRETTEKNSKSPGYELLNHTTPSALLQKSKTKNDKKGLYSTSSNQFLERANRDKLDPRLIENRDVCNSPLPLKVICATDLDHTSLSKVVSKSLDKDGTSIQQNFPGYREFNHKDPSKEKSQDHPSSCEGGRKFKISRQASMPKTLKRNITKKESSTRGQVSNSSSGDEIKINPTPSRLLQKKDREMTSENPRTPGYEKYLDGTTPSMLLKNVEQKMNGKGSADQFIRKGSSAHTKQDPQVPTSSPERTLSDSGNWTLPTPSKLTMDLLNSDPSSPGSLHVSNEVSQESFQTEKSQQQQENFNNWRTFSDITAYYIELSDFVSKMARKMRMRSEPHFIGTSYDVSALGMEDSHHTHSYSSTESNEEIIEPDRIHRPGVSAERQNNELNKTRQDYEPRSISGGSLTEQSTIYDADSEYVCNSGSTAYPLSSSDETSVTGMSQKSSFNSCFRIFSDSASSDEEDEEYQAGSSTTNKAKNLFMRDSSDLNSKSVNDMLWSLYLKSPDEKKRIDSLASLLSLYFTNYAPSSSLLDFCSDPSTSSVASTAHPTNHKQGRYEGTQKKRNLPNMRSATPDGRGMMMEKEMMESQNRKLQMEISTLQTENKLLKDKYNRASAKINHLEEQLAESREQLESLHGNLNQELSEVERRNKSQAIEEMDLFQAKILTLTKENESLKNEVSSLEKQLESANKNMDRALLNSEKNRTLDAHKLEITTLKDEVTRVKSLLEQSERHLQEEDSRTKELSQQVIKLTEMKNLLQQQIEMGGGGATATDKQIKSLEKRLRVTEERLHQERADRANNLSQVEDKLLTENARLQATEKDLNRQLHREKDKNRNLENKIKDTREDNERLRLSLPFDEAALTTQKGYDIPYGVHASQRQETVKKDYRQILSQLEAESGLKPGQEKDMICQLWNTRQQTYHQLRQLEITLQALNLRDNNIAEGLKNLRDVKSHADAQLKQLQEQLDDARSEREIQETTYKEQLALLVNERHDAFARLKTCEDLMEAIRSENEILKSSLAGGGATSLGTSLTLATNGRIEALQAKIKDLEGQIQQMTRTTCLLEGELSTLRIQLEARDKALEDAQSELDIAHSHLTGDGGENRKQEKIDKLTSQINDHQSEIKLLRDKVTSLNSEKSRLERDLEASLREVNIAKAKVKETKHGEMTDNKQLLILREELEERDRRLGKLTQEYDSLETELQTARQDLYAEQIQSQDYEAQIESFQSQIEQRGQILDTLSGTEKEQLAQFQILKETLDSVSQELNQKCAEMKVLQLEMSKEKDRYEYMEKELTTLKRDRPLKEDDQAVETSLPSHMLQIRELETERDHLKTELIETTEALKQATEENGNLDKAMKQMEQVLMEEKSAHLQTTADRGELEQHLEEIAEEHDALSQERDQSEEDIVRLETSLKDVVHKFEMEARKSHENFASKYPQVPAEALKMAGELDSLRTLMEAKHKEHEMLNDKINRQQVEMDFLNRRVELLHNENQCNRDDIARLTSEVSAKIKEGVANREMNQFLVKERARLQKENTQLTASVEKEKGIKERRRAEIADIMRKVEKTEESSKTTSREVSQKDAIIASLEAELGQTKQTCQSLEVDRSQLLGKVDNLQQDVENKVVLTSTLETHLETERGRESLDVQQQSCTKLQEQVNALTRELESTQTQLTTSRETVEGLKQDKGAIYQEYDSMIRRLSERDQTIAELQNKCDRTEQQMQKELTLQKHSLERENTSTERDLEVTKEENSVLKEELKQKEAQLSSFGRTLKELEDVNKEKLELEGKVRHMESTVGDSDLLTQSLRKETMTLQETIARQQESLSTLQLDHSALRDKMRIQEEKLTDQILVLEKTNNDLRNQYDGEKSYLKDNLMQTQTRVASVESSLASAIESRDRLQINSRMQERSLEETKEHLQEEMTSRKIAEQRAESLQSQLHELRKDKFLSEEKLNQMATTLTKTEQMVKTEKDRAKRLSDQQQELEATVYSQESSTKAKQEQLELQQNEIGKLRQILESQKQQLNAKLKKTTTELKQQLEIIEEDRVRVIQQNQLLSADVERARDQLAMKNKENLQLQETILGQEDQLREHTLQLRRAEDARKAEEELQSKLSSKFAAQEEELKRMKIYLSKKAEEAGDNEKSMWMDLNRLIQDMNRQLHEHMESQKSGGQDSKDRDGKQLSKYKKRVIDLESELSTEKAVHQITKSSLQALEEDNQRLRHQYHAMRRRDNVTSDKKYKSRMEAINEIIAKSQTQAQAMLAASGYYDDPQKSLYSPRTDYRGSPDNSLASDLSFNSTGPMVIPPYTGSSPTKATTGTGSPRK